MDVRRVAQAVEGAADGGESRLARPPGDLRDAAADVQADLVHAAENRRQLLDEPDAGGTVDALQVEPRAAPLGAGLLGPVRLDALVVEVREGPSRHPRRLEAAPLLADEPIVLIESPLVDERVDLPAAGATELPILAFPHEACRPATRNARTPHGARLPPRGRHRRGARSASRAALRRTRRSRAEAGQSEPDHRSLPTGTAASSRTVTRAAWTNRSACCFASMRSSQVPGSSRRTRVR